MSITFHEDTVVASKNEIDDDLKVVEGTIVIRFAAPDRDNPFDWRPVKKWYFILYFHLSISRINIILKGDGPNRNTLYVSPSSKSIITLTTSRLERL